MLDKKIEARAEKIAYLFSVKEDLKKSIEKVDTELTEMLGGKLMEVKTPKITENIKPGEIIKTRKKKRWCRKYDACRDCGTTDKQHSGQGYCAKCYAKNVVNKKDESGDKLKGYKCEECEHWFQTEKEKIDAYCPMCNSIRVAEKESDTIIH